MGKTFRMLEALLESLYGLALSLIVATYYHKGLVPAGIVGFLYGLTSYILLVWTLNNLGSILYCDEEAEESSFDLTSATAALFLPVLFLVASPFVVCAWLVLKKEGREKIRQ